MSLSVSVSLSLYSRCFVDSSHTRSLCFTKLLRLYFHHSLGESGAKSLTASCYYSLQNHTEEGMRGQPAKYIRE